VLLEKKVEELGVGPEVGALMGDALKVVVSEAATVVIVVVVAASNQPSIHVVEEIAKVEPPEHFPELEMIVRLRIELILVPMVAEGQEMPG